MIEVLYKLIKDRGFSVKSSNERKTNLVDSLYKGPTKKALDAFISGQIEFHDDASIIGQVLFRSGIRSTSAMILNK